MPQTKQLLQNRLGYIWKNARSPIFRHFQSWKLSVQQSKHQQKAEQIAENHQYVHTN